MRRVIKALEQRQYQEVNKLIKQIMEELDN